MIPRLATRGKLVVASAFLFLLVGALHGAPPLVGMSGIALAALLASYLAFYPTAILLRRKKIELSWWVPPGDQPGGALAVDRPFALHLAFRNHGSRTLRILGAKLHAASSLELGPPASATVRAGRQVEVTSTIRPLAPGYQVFHGAALLLGDLLGLFEVEAYFPNPIAVKVFPRQLPARQRAVRPVGGALHEQVGLHQVRRRGLAGELRELREHAHGDPFKFIAWKATARRGKLMTRDLESEIVATQMLVIDVGAGMRVGALGRAPLDWAIDTASAIARAAATGGDRVGMIGFDTRRYVELAPGSGHHHWLQLIDRLLDARTVVDEDLTDVTAGELVALVARYLAHQEAIDVRVRVAPALDDPRWSSIQAGPDGQLYDLAATNRLVGKLLDVMGTDKKRILAPQWWWSRPHAGDADPQLAPLRLFCRLRGIELPYRPLAEHGKRASGFADAIEHAVKDGRPDAVVILSDLGGLAEAQDKTARALARARRAAGQVIALVPSPRRFLPVAESELAARVRSVVVRDAELAMASARKLFARAGAIVIECGPGDAPAQLLRRTGPGGPVRRVA
jgi:uncharacterized protein (DUF58 family)